jgi:phage internal scaffolding protein
MKTGELPTPRQGFYADVSEVPDLTQALNIVQQAQQAFDSLPAKIRYEFHNDPSQLLKFISDPQNKERAIELGLIEKKQQEVVPEPSTASEGSKDGQTQGE